MPIIRKAVRLILFSLAAITISGVVSTAMAQPAWGDSNPCETRVEPFESHAHRTIHGLTPADDGVVYDSNQGVCWLADANLAGHTEVRKLVPLSIVNPDGSMPVINPDGTMDYETALNWVNALNNYNNGKGWLNHNNWQLPTNPSIDRTCSASNVDNFGAQCTGSALGNLYNVGLAKIYPASVVPRFYNFVWPFLNLQPGLYWSASPNNGGEATFSFNTGIPGGNTTQYNLFHVLPMTRMALGPIPAGTGVLPYRSGPAAGKAVYDTLTGLSWTLNANLPAVDNFGVTSTATITANMNGKTNGGTVTVPLVDPDGAVYLSATVPVEKCVTGGLTSGLSSEWIVAMNTSAYAGSNKWELPCNDDMKNLYSDMGLTAGDTRMEWPFNVGPFQRLQAGFYWACVRAASATESNGPCDLSQSAPAGLQWSFNFDDGFEGTDLPSKQFYVMVYYPAPKN
jgi:hypothetical protein